MGVTRPPGFFITHARQRAGFLVSALAPGVSMPQYSIQSAARLAECHPELQLLFNEVIKDFDCSIITGHRDEATQNRMVAEGKSQVGWPNSKHNGRPSMAVDAAPYPINWADRERFHLFAGFVLGTASRLRAQGLMSHAVRWGGDWDRDTHVDDNSFDDLPHFELI